MHCQNVSTILDNRAQLKLTAAERCELDAHLATCADCERAWHAQEALLAQPIPAMRPGLLEDTLRLIVSQRRSPSARRYRSRLVLGAAVLAAGAALAAITVVTKSRRTHENIVPVSTASTSTMSQSAAQPPAAADQTPLVGSTNDIDPVNFPDGDYFVLLMAPPEYPLEALKEKREGRVQLQYTITKKGTVADATVVESTDSAFDAAAVLAVERWKYMPRVVAGKRVDVPGIRTIIRFQLALPEPADESDRPNPPESPRNGPALRDLLAPAWECAGIRDLLCAQQVLDEVSAAYDLTPFEQHTVLTFYGYIYTQYEDYERALSYRGLSPRSR